MSARPPERAKPILRTLTNPIRFAKAAARTDQRIRPAPNAAFKNPYKSSGMFAGADSLVFELAKNLRRTMTDAETILWMHLKNGINGLKIRRQHPVGIYIADFYYHKIKLIIEVDGLIHNETSTKEYDIKRENDLKTLGYHILRFSNKEIFIDIENVVERIKTKVEDLFQNSIINKK